MMSYEERMELLEKALEKETAESLFEKLKSYGTCYEIPDICFKSFQHYENKVQRRIVSAANKFYIGDEEKDFIVISSARHYSPVMSKVVKLLKANGVNVKAAYGDNQGFIDQFDDYWTREEALIIATYAGQLNTVREKSSPLEQLFSEDLY